MAHLLIPGLASVMTIKLDIHGPEKFGAGADHSIRVEKLAFLGEPSHRRACPQPADTHWQTGDRPIMYARHRPAKTSRHVARSAP
jgi:hypothetical protein